MFFYSEPSEVVIVPLTLLANTSSLYLTDACVGTSSQITFTISSSGNTTETIYLSDNSNQFDFSPSSFLMTGSVTSQIVTVTFTPTKPWGLKTGNLTVSASGGSVITLAMSGNAVAVPLALTSSLNSIIFSETSVNSTNSQSFIVSAGGFSSVEETITVSDDSNQFSFSPSSFGLTGSGNSQTVTATFTPTSIGVKTGNITLNSSGGSTKIVSLQGTGIDQNNNTVLLLKGEGTINAGNNNFIDSSTSSLAVTRYGTVTQGTFSPYSSPNNVGAGSAYFNGTTDYLTLPANNTPSSITNPFYIDNRDFTFETWFYATPGGSGQYSTLFSNYVYSSGNYGYAFFLKRNASQLLGFQITNAAVPAISVDTTMSFNTWYHVAFTRQNGTVRIFLNGTLISTTAAWTYRLQGVYTPAIGARVYSSTSDNKHLGYLSDVRMITGSALYTSNFSVPTSKLQAVSGTTLLVNFANSNIIDSTNKNNITTNGDIKISNTKFKYGSSSLSFDGSGDYLDVISPSSSSFAFGTGDFTIEFWMNTTQTNANIMNPATLSGGGFWGLLIQASKIRWNNSYNSTNLWENNTGFIDGLESKSIIDGNWHHIAISRQSGITKLFFDGLQQNAFTDTTNYTYMNASTDKLRIGKGNLADLNAYIDDLRITKGIARYTGSFTPPTAL